MATHQMVKKDNVSFMRLVDDVTVGYLDDGSVVTMRWPIA